MNWRVELCDAGCRRRTGVRASKNLEWSFAYSISGSSLVFRLFQFALQQTISRGRTPSERHW